MSTATGLVRGLDAYQKMLDLIFGYRLSQAVRGFADLSLADHHAGDPLTAAVRPSAAAVQITDMERIND